MPFQLIIQMTNSPDDYECESVIIPINNLQDDIREIEKKVQQHYLVDLSVRFSQNGISIKQLNQIEFTNNKATLTGTFYL